MTNSAFTSHNIYFVAFKGKLFIAQKETNEIKNRFLDSNSDFSNPYIFAPYWFKPVFQTLTIDYIIFCILSSFKSLQLQVEKM